MSIMSPEEFFWWMHGLSHAMNVKRPNQEQWDRIKSMINFTINSINKSQLPLSDYVVGIAALNAKSSSP
jgi:hypothetical protein